MTPFQTILYPVDFSEAAAAMAPYVREMAQRFNAGVIVLHACDLLRDYVFPPGAQDYDAIPYTPALSQLRKEREKRLREFAGAHFASVRHAVRLEDGEPASVIEWVARRESVGLVAMSTRGYGKFRRLLVGSVTLKVLHDLTCPVLTGAHDPGPSGAPGAGFHSIVCAVEFSREAEAVIDVAIHLAEAYGARLCLLHMQSSSRREGGQESIESLRRKFQEVALRQAIPAHVAKAAIQPKVCVLDDGVPEGVRLESIAEGADLVVTGRGLERGNLSRVWSQLYAIIRESPCPVLSVCAVE